MCIALHINLSGWHPGVWEHDAGGGEGAPEKDEEVGISRTDTINDILEVNNVFLPGREAKHLRLEAKHRRPAAKHRARVRFGKRKDIIRIITTNLDNHD